MNTPGFIVSNPNGMMFNKRRQSKDIAVIKKVNEILAGETLYVSEYTKAIFPNGKVCDDFSSVEGFAFLENPKDIDLSKIDTLYIFYWNRHYPSDKKFTASLENYEKIHEEEFVGNSHENITLSVFGRR